MPLRSDSCVSERPRPRQLDLSHWNENVVSSSLNHHEDEILSRFSKCREPSRRSYADSDQLNKYSSEQRSRRDSQSNERRNSFQDESSLTSCRLNNQHETDEFLSEDHVNASRWNEVDRSDYLSREFSNNPSALLESQSLASSNRNAESLLLNDKVDSIRSAESPLKAPMYHGTSAFDEIHKPRASLSSSSNENQLEDEFHGRKFKTFDRMSLQRFNENEKESGTTLSKEHDLDESLYHFRKKMREVFIRIEDMVDVHRSFFKSDLRKGSLKCQKELEQQAEKLATNTFEQLASLRNQFTCLAREFQQSQDHSSNFQDHRWTDNSSNQEDEQLRTSCEYDDNVTMEKQTDGPEFSISTLNSCNDNECRPHTITTLFSNDSKNFSNTEDMFKDFDKRMENIRNSLHGIANGEKTRYHRNVDEVSSGIKSRIQRISRQYDDDNESQSQLQTGGREMKVRQLLKKLNHLHASDDTY
ncbi:hypothetical protein Plhal703r1_c05g0030901 [Plasmopara halstedii]